MRRARDGGRRSRRLRNVLIVAALLAVAIPGIASRISPEPALVEVPDLGGAYIEATVGNPSYLNPLLLQFNQVDRDIASLIFAGLTRFDETGVIAPDMAERWDVSDDGKSYTFYLRRNVRWHDHTPFTSDDVVFTTKAMQAPDYQGSPEVGELWRNVAVEQIDDYTVRFALKEPFAPFIEYTTVGILPRHLYLDSVGKAMLTSSYNLRPIGTGPFKLTRISAEGVVLEPHADYHGAQAHLAQLRFRFYPDYASALAALDMGEVDAVPYLDPQDVSRLADNQKLSMYSIPDYLRYAVLFLNGSTTPFNDKAVRQALGYAIDKDRIIQMVMARQAVPGKGPISPGSWAFNPSIQSYGYDPGKAASILDAAGWTDTDGDGVREKEGTALSFVILTNDNKSRIKMGEMVAEDVRKAGFRTEVQAMGWTDLLKSYLGPRTYLGAIAEQWLLTADPDVFSLWHSSQIGDGGFNFSGPLGDRADKLLEDARRTSDRVERTKDYSEFQQIWADESPAVILYHPKFNWAVSRNIKGVRLTALVDGSSRFRNLAEWYVKTKLVPESPTK